MNDNINEIEPDSSIPNGEKENYSAQSYNQQYAYPYGRQYSDNPYNAPNTYAYMADNAGDNKKTRNRSCILRQRAKLLSCLSCLSCLQKEKKKRNENEQED